MATNATQLSNMTGVYDEVRAMQILSELEFTTAEKLRRPDLGTRDALRALAVAIGADEDSVDTFDDNALFSLYSVARKSLAAAPAVLRKIQGKANSNVAGGAAVGAGMTRDELYQVVQDEVHAQIKAPITDVGQAIQRALMDEYRAFERGLIEVLPDRIETAIKALVPNTLVVTVGNAPAVTFTDTPHKALPKLLQWLALREHVYLVGPAGSGKTTGAEQAAQALGVPFYFTGAVKSETDLLGFISPITGHYHRTPFRDAFEHGGLFLLDEMDGSEADAVLPFNQALANGACAFPDGLVRAHKDFYCIGAANTFGRGADRQYVGRNQLDAATLDRFVQLVWDYDEQLELRITADEKWTRFVQLVRRVINDNKVRHVMSPRTSIKGGKALAAGQDWADVEADLIWHPMDEATRAKLQVLVLGASESGYTMPSELVGGTSKPY